MSTVMEFAGLTVDAIAAVGGFWYPEN